MKKPYNVISKASLAAIFAASAIVPVATASAEAASAEISKVVYELNGKLISVTMNDFENAIINGEFDLDLDSIKYVQLNNGKNYSMSDYENALINTDSAEDATQSLAEKTTPADISPLEGSYDKDGNVVAEDETPSKLETAKAALEALVEEATAIEGLEEAVAEATAVLEDAEATLEDVQNAITALQAAIDDAATVELAVESVSAINETAIEVTLAEDAEVTAEDLAEATITLTADETTLTATYAEGSLANGKAVFNLAEGEKLVDATVYTLASDAVTFDVESFTAKVVNAYAATFATDTAAVTASTEEEAKAGNTERTLKVTAKDQYGEDFSIVAATNVVVEGSTLNGMPLTTGSGKEVHISGDTVTVKRTLVEGDKLVIKVSSKDGDKVLGTSNIEFTVAKAAAPVATSVAGVKAEVNNAVPTAIVAGDLVTLTPDVRDQNNSVAAKADLRYVVTAGADLLKAGSEGGKKLGNNVKTIDTDLDSSAGKVTFETDKPGTVTIDVFNVSNGAKYTYTVEVGATKLTTISNPITASGFNNEEIKTGKVTPTPGAAFTPEMIKFNITDANGNATTDVKVEAKVAEEASTTPSLAKGDIYFVAKTTKTGTYKVQPYVGSSFTDAAAVKGQVLTITSTLNSVATAIDTITVGDVKVDTPVTKEIVVRNKHNEDITKESLANIKFDVYKDGAKLAEGVGIAKPEVTLNNTTKKYEVKVKAIAAGEYTVRAYVNGSAATQDFAVKAEATKLASINLGTDIYDGVIAGDSEAIYRVITAKDNKGDNILPEIDGTTPWKVVKGTDVSVEATSGVTVEYVEKDEDGKWKDTDKDNAEAVALKIDPSGLTAGKATYTVSNGLAANNADLVKDSIDITVKEARSLSTLAVEPLQSSVGVGGVTLIKVTPKDQYGKFNPAEDKIQLDSSNTNVADKGSFLATGIAGQAPKLGIDVAYVAVDKDGKVVTDMTKAVAYIYAVKGIADGDAVITVKDKTPETKVSAVTTNIKVSPASDIVKSLDITHANLNADGTYKYELGATAEIEFGLVAQDESGNAVPVNAEQVRWTSSNDTLVKVDGGTITVQAAAAQLTESKTVTITADLFGVKETIQVTVSKDGAVNDELLDGTFFFKGAGSVTAEKVDADGNLENGLQIKLDGDDKDGEKADGTIVLTFKGYDVAGKEVSPKIDDELEVEIFRTAVVDKTEGADTITITPKAVGETKVRVIIGSQEYTFDVSVTENNKIIKDAKELADEVSKFKTDHATILGKTTENVALTDETAITTALAAFELLSAGAKAELTTQKSLLDGLKGKIAAIKPVSAVLTVNSANITLSTENQTVSSTVVVKNAAVEAISGTTKAGTFSVEVPEGAVEDEDYTFDTTTGELVILADSAVEGTYTIKYTNTALSTVTATATATVTTASL